MGSPSGDVDDGFAIAALLRAGIPIAAITTVAGNTTEELSYRNTAHICELLGYKGPLLRAANAGQVLRNFTGRLAALGPLTNAVEATRASEVVVVGGWLHTAGRWPPLWPHEFNLTFDRDAAKQLFHSGVPLTIFPLDISRQLWARASDLDRIAGPFGELARRESKRWFRHLLLLRQTRRFAIYDLAAALYLIDEEGFVLEQTAASMRNNTFIEFGKGTRPVKVCTGLRRELLWGRFVRLFA